MHIRVEAKAFSSALGWAARRIPARPSKTSHLGVVIQTLEETAFVGISTSDGESVSNACAGAEVIQKGVICVSGKLLADIVGSLGSGTIELQLEGNKVAITSGGSRFSLPTIPVSEHSEAPKPGVKFGAVPAASGTIAAAAFAGAVSQVATAASRDDSMPALTAVQLSAGEKSLVLAATDRYRVAVREIAWTPAEDTELGSLLLAATTLTDATSGILAAGTETIAISAPSETDARVTFAGKGRIARTRVLAGEFPKWDGLFAACARDQVATATVETAVLREALTRVGKVLGKTDAVRLRFSEGQCIVEGGAADQAQAVELIGAEFSGEDLTIAFNPQFLADGLAACASPNATIAMSTPMKPVVITGSNAGFRYLLMPVRI